MRLDHEIQFWLGDDTYNPKTHQYGDARLVATALANVTDLGTARSVELFGHVDAQSKVVRLVEPVGAHWSYLTIDGGEDHFAPQTVRVPLKNTTLIVGEDNGQRKTGLPSAVEGPGQVDGLAD